MKLSLVCASFIFFTPFVFADNVPRLDEAIAKTLAHSQEIAIARARVAQTDAHVHAARRGWFHPELRVFAGESATTGTTRAGIQVSQDLLRLLSLNHDEVRQAEHERAVATQTLLLTQERIVHQVSEALAHLEQADVLVRVNAEAVIEQETRLALAQAQFDDATGTLEQLLAVRHAHVHAQQELAQSQDALRLARLTVAQLLGNSGDTYLTRELRMCPRNVEETR